jgi:hypothetical protein
MATRFLAGRVDVAAAPAVLRAFDARSAASLLAQWLLGISSVNED